MTAPIPQGASTEPCLFDLGYVIYGDRTGDQRQVVGWRGHPVLP